ncbi:MAG: heme-binding protein [Alphaproteobacteria bacterium]|nr:heme-binding protein [Alphaproteobacteria bacterium]
MSITSKLALEAIERGIAVGLKRNFFVACALVDPSGRTIGVLRHEKAQWMTPDFAIGKAILASAYKNRTQAMYDRLQKERPLYGTMVASLTNQYGWLLVEGGTSVNRGEGESAECVVAVGISGCFPAAVDQEVADEVAAWLKGVLVK